MPRVLQLTPTYFSSRSLIGGGERYPTNIALAVNLQRGWVAELASMAGDVKEPTQMLLPSGVMLWLLPASLPSALHNAVPRRFVEVFERFDVIHVHQVFTKVGELAVLAGKLLGKAVCVTDHGGMLSTLGRSSGMLEHVDAVVANSDFSMNLLNADRLPTRRFVIKGGVDDRFFSPPGKTPSRSYVLFCGRVLPHKGVDRLIIALPDRLPLVVCGPQPDAGYLRYLHRLARHKRVIFMNSPEDSELRDLYRDALCVVLPSVYEDYLGNYHGWPELMGLTLLEGMACGTPAVCSRVGGMPEFVKPEVTGFVYDSLHELRKILTDLASNRSLVETLGGNSARFVREHFGLKVVGGLFVDVYSGLLTGKKGSLYAHSRDQ